MSNIKIEYDGKYPNLCSGHLSVTVDGVEWEFPAYCLSSGGTVRFTKDYDEIVTHGPWSVSEWPAEFPDDKRLRRQIEDEINAEVPAGCCGGCV